VTAGRTGATDETCPRPVSTRGERQGRLALTGIRELYVVPESKEEEE